MAEGTISVAGERSAPAKGSGSGPAHLRASAFPRGPVTVRGTGPDALSNLVAVLELAADGQLRCAAATRRPLAATVRLVEDALVAGDYYDRRDEGEPVAAFAWPMLLQAGGLARLAGTRLELTPRGEAVLAAPCYPALGELWDRWLRSVSQDELTRIEAIRGQRRTGTLTAPARRRAAVADGLAALATGVWVEVDAAVRGAAGAARPARGGRKPADPMGALPGRSAARIARPGRREGVECPGGPVRAVRALRVRGHPRRGGRRLYGRARRPCRLPRAAGRGQHTTACPATTAWPPSGSTSWARPSCTIPAPCPPSVSRCRGGFSHSSSA